MSSVAGVVVQLIAVRGESVFAGALLAEVATRGGPEASNPSRAAGPRSGSAQYLVAHAAQVTAAVLAAGAFVWPTAWLAGAALAGLASLAVRGLRLNDGARGPADVVVVPLRLAGNALRQLGKNIAQIAPLMSAIALTAFWLGLAIVIPAAIGGGTWLLMHGADGALAASRVAVLSHGYPLLSFIASYVTLRRLLSEPARIERLRRSADDVPEIALTGALVGGAAWLLLCAAVLTPRPAWPASSLHAIVHALPQPISDPAQDGLAALAEYEAQEVVDCLEQRGLGEWGSATAKTGNAGAILISVRASHAQAPSDGALARSCSASRMSSWDASTPSKSPRRRAARDCASRRRARPGRSRTSLRSR